jgi:TonB family protein
VTSSIDLRRWCLLALAMVVMAGCASAPGDPARRGPAESIAIDTVDPRYAPYLTLVRDKIRSNWRYPCIKNASTGACDYQNAGLDIEFGILKTGAVQFVDVKKSSGSALYDDAAVDAIRSSSPFPEVPAVFMEAMREGSTGIPIRARFKYVVETPPR